jgi:hypothetical protein
LLSQDAKEDIYQLFNKKNLPSLLGSKEFINQIRSRFFAQLVHPEKLESKNLAINSERIIELVCGQFGLEKNKSSVKSEELTTCLVIWRFI